mmetsp:Transcript_5244/g.13203  ORF Transcript_5244/g.13203 Transcript_5244/m.13203 type:complete len:306 (-) Transcript_5244:86-1003(-)
MAIPTNDNQTLDTVQMSPELQQSKHWSKKRSTNQQQQQQKMKNNDDCYSIGGESSDADSSFSSSSSSSASAQAPRNNRRRRRRQRGRGGGTKKATAKQAQQSELTDEEKAQYVAMDCEMVGAGVGGHRSILARVTIVDWNGQVLFDQYVQPTEAVTDYRTFVSGITQQDLEGAEDIHDCRAKVADILRNKVLIGHHLKNDLKAIGLTHPWFDTRDTAKWDPFMKVRFNDGILWPRKLRELAFEKLNKRVIQVAGKPHSPIEDAVTALDLYKLVRNKWEKAVAYKVNKTREIMEQQIAMDQQQQQR